MTKFNTYKTTTLGAYGNASEIIFINKYGKAFIIESPDMPLGKDAVSTDNYLPVDMVALGDKDCADLDVPEWVYEWK